MWLWVKYHWEVAQRGASYFGGSQVTLLLHLQMLSLVHTRKTCCWSFLARNISFTVVRMLLMIFSHWSNIACVAVFKEQLQQKLCIAEYLWISYFCILNIHFKLSTETVIILKKTTLMVILFCAKNSTRPKVYNKFTMEMAFTFWEEGCDWSIRYLHPAWCGVGAASYQSWFPAVSG